MQRGDTLEARFEKRLRSRPNSDAAEIDDDGLVLGAGTILSRMDRNASGATGLAINADEDRIFALLIAEPTRRAEALSRSGRRRPE